MKNFRQLVRELPSSTVVVTTGTFNPPTAKHELQFKLVEKLVNKHNAQHVIYISESKEGLPTARKTHFLNLMFNNFNFVPLTGSLKEEVSKLKSKYKNVIVLGDSIKGKLAESVEQVPFEDIDSSKIKSMVTKGDYTSFKYLMPSSFRDIDAKRMFNEMRQSYGLEFMKEDLKFSIDSLRDKYFKGEIYQIGDIVESAGEQYEIMDRGSNYLVVVNNTGDLSRKWIKDVNLVEACWKGYKQYGMKAKGGRKVPNCVPEEVEEVKEAADSSQFCYKGYTTKNFHHCAQTASAFKLSAQDVKDPVAMLKAVKTTDTYLDMHNHRGDNPTIDQIKSWKSAHIQAKDTLVKLGKFDAHQEHWLQNDEALTKMLGPHAAKLKENFEIDKHSNYNIAKSVMSYQDFMKLNKMNTGVIKDTKQPPFNHPIEPNITQQIDDLQDWPFHPQTEVGHTLATRRHLRRQKVTYATESLQGDLMDEDFAAKFTTEANSGEVGDEIGNDKINKVKTLPPQLMPKDDSKRLGGGTRDHTFSAFMERNKKAKKENVEIGARELMNYRLAKENK
jgi:hypothetical protein